VTERGLNAIEDLATDGTEYGAIHSRQYLASDGASVEHPAAGSLILLYTTGRNTGKIRRTPLRFFALDDGDLLVAATARGSDTNPNWYSNLVTDSRVWVRHDADIYEATASSVDGEERDHLWSTVVVPRAPQFADYQAATERVIPLVRLHA
jgi:deazaflavin-dependent oxidoreductase (nitroreductase family)